MRFLELLKAFRSLISLPDFSSKEEVKAWLLVWCDVAAMVTSKTSPTADDVVVAFFRKAVENPDLFDPIFTLLSNLLASDGEAPKVMESPILAEAAKEAAIDPVTILAIIEAIASIIKFIRERRNK